MKKKTEDEYLSGYDPCRAPEGDKPGTVKIACKNCGYVWQGKIGYAYKCPECGSISLPKYPLRFTQILQKGFEMMKANSSKADELAYFLGER